MKDGVQMECSLLRRVMRQQPTVEQVSDIICNSGTHLSLVESPHGFTSHILKGD